MIFEWTCVLQNWKIMFRHKVNKGLVAWFSRQEFSVVYEELFSENSLQQKHAVDRISIWKCRLMQLLPVAVECSGELVTALLQYNQALASNTLTCRELEVRLTLAMAVIRFINLITDKEQVKTFNLPIHELADYLDIPEWLVDLRHESTHSNLPTLPLLLLAVGTALSWLKENYWIPQIFGRKIDPTSDQFLRELQKSKEMATNHDEVPPQSGISLLKAQLQAYIKSYLQSVHDDEVQQHWDTVETSIEKFFNRRTKKRLIDVLISNDLLIPSRVHLKLLQLNSSELVHSPSPVLPENWSMCWQPMLDLFTAKNLILPLLAVLCQQLQEKANLRNYFVCAWISHVLDHLPKSIFRNSDRKVSDLPTSACGETPRALLHLVHSSPSIYTVHLLNRLFNIDSCGLTSDQQTQLIECVGWYTGTLPIPEEEVVPDSQVPESVLVGADGDSAWVRDTTVLNWAYIPLGSYPGTTLTYCSLELPAAVNFVQPNFATDEFSVDMSIDDTSTIIHDEI